MKVRITKLVDDYDETVEIADNHSLPCLLNSPSVVQIAVELTGGETFFYRRIEEETE